MAIADLLSSGVIKVGLTSRDKPSVLRELVRVLIDAGKIHDEENVLRALLRREELQSTGLTGGVAVPHAKTGAVSSLTLALGISRKGIDFDAADGCPSRLFFLMLAPPDRSGPHIEALAEIARRSQSATFTKAVISAPSAEEVLRLFRKNEASHTPA